MLIRNPSLTPGGGGGQPPMPQPTHFMSRPPMQANPVTAPPHIAPQPTHGVMPGPVERPPQMQAPQSPRAQQMMGLLRQRALVAALRGGGGSAPPSAPFGGAMTSLPHMR